MDNSNQVWIAASLRALVIALVTGVSAGTAALASGSDDRQAIIAGVSAAAAALLVRLAGEGGYDSNRAKTGNVQPGDVGRSITVVNEPAVKP